MSDTADGLGASPRDESEPEEGAESATTPQPDPAATDHPTGEEQAAENEDLELPG